MGSAKKGRRYYVRLFSLAKPIPRMIPGSLTKEPYMYVDNIVQKHTIS